MCVGVGVSVFVEEGTKYLGMMGYQDVSSESGKHFILYPAA